MADFACPECGDRVVPVWAVYQGRATVVPRRGLWYIGTGRPVSADAVASGDGGGGAPRPGDPPPGLEGHGTLRLPFHRCPRGHLSGWTERDDFFADLALYVRSTDFGGLETGAVTPRRRFLRRPRCGNCGKRLILRLTGQRLRPTVRVVLTTCPDPLEFELDIPAAACSVCGARPDPNSRIVSETVLDVWSWIFQLIANAVAPERAVEVRPRREVM